MLPIIDVAYVKSTFFAGLPHGLTRKARRLARPTL